MCLSTHDQSVHMNCVSSSKKLQGNHRHLCPKVHKSRAISWFHKVKAFQHIVPELSYAQALTKGSNPKHTVSLDKTPYHHMVPPIFSNKVKKGLNPQAKHLLSLKGVFTNDFIMFRVHSPISILKTDPRDQ